MDDIVRNRSGRKHPEHGERASMTIGGARDCGVDSRTSPPPALSGDERRERLRRAVERAPDYGMEIPPPPVAP
jgi:hypothetical protein